MTPPSENKPRAWETTNAKKTAKMRVAESIGPSAPKTRTRRLLRAPPQRKKKYIDEVCLDINISLGLSNFKFVKYDTLDNDDKNRNEEAMIEMMSNFKLSPSEI